MKKIIVYRSIESINISRENAQLIAKRKKNSIQYLQEGVHQSLIDSTDINTSVLVTFDEAMGWLGISIDT